MGSTPSNSGSFLGQDETGGVDNRIVNRKVAPGAPGFERRSGALVEDLGKGPETLGTANRNVRASWNFTAGSRNPDGGQ